MRAIKFQTAVRLIVVLWLVLLIYPAMSVLAAETTPAADTSSSTTSNSETTKSTAKDKKEAKKKAKATNPGPTKPTGADANTYTYNEDTGLWENEHYTWDPATNQTAPKSAPTYSYNPSTDMWDTTDWRYDAPSGQYVPNVTSTSTQPDSVSGANNANPLSNSTLANPSSNPNLSLNSNANDAYNLFYNAQISNVINSTASTGAASVTQNTAGGSALSGNAQAMANVINMLQSSWGAASNGQVTTFINNIDGDVFGDLMIDPGSLPASTISTNQDEPNSNFDLNVQNNGSIDNQINLAANSGNANVNSNTAGGNATTGTADAVANVVNMINSTIASGHSFVGMININGNLNGDILLPADMIKQLLASDSVPKTTIDTSKLSNGSLLANFNDNATINNHVTSDASSGQANVSNNTSAGNATTGNASTNLTIMNLTGKSIIGDDCLLVFVNVLGSWVGMIVNAPGSTSAALGSGITDTKMPATDTEANVNNNSTINNDINLSAHSGDANVTDNTKAGNAATGNASTSVNLLNLINTQISMSKWFGILFINVFGSWHGSFGVDTSAGNPAPTSAKSNKGGAMKVFKFVATSGGGNGLQQVYSSGATDDSSSSSTSKNQAVLASSTGGSKGQPQTIFSNPAASGINSSWIIAAVSISLGLGMLGAERALDWRKK